MPFSMTASEGKQILHLEGAVTITHARKLAAMVGESLDESMPLEVESRQLADIDTCILQFLCSLQRTVPQLTFATPSTALLIALERSQLRRALLGAGETL